jgi:putative transposase
LVDYTREEHGLSIRSACTAVSISRSVYHYQPDASKDDAVIAEMQAIVERCPAYGFGKVFAVLKRAGHPWNHKRVYRVYCALNLNLRRKGKKRLPSRNPEPLVVPADMNQCWSIDFMSDSLFCGRRFRTFNVVDDYNREALAIEVDRSLPSVRVVRVLERIVAWRGYPVKIRMANGPEFISVTLADWADKNDIQLEFIKPGKPTQNSYVERFNRTYRTEVLNMYAFRRLSEVREITDNWVMEYNEERPHDSLGDLTPREYLTANSNRENSKSSWS